MVRPEKDQRDEVSEKDDQVKREEERQVEDKVRFGKVMIIVSDVLCVLCCMAKVHTS